MGTLIRCASCKAGIPAGSEVCPYCGQALVPKPSMLSAVTYEVPEVKARFERRCPWCGNATRPEMVGISFGSVCGCGAVAIGAPGCDFDEVVDDAINHFRLDVKAVVNRAHDPGSWMELFGVEFREGGSLRQLRTEVGYVFEEEVKRLSIPVDAAASGREIFFYWFKRTAPPPPPRR